MARPEAAAVAMGRVLVTGATGFIGRDLVVRLARAGWTVRALARDVARVPAAPGIEPWALPVPGGGDLEGEPDWAPVLEGVTHAVHLAGLAHSRKTIPEARYRAINAAAVERLAGAARVAGLARVVFVSSVRAQTGPVAAGVLDERSQARPTDAYGRAKLAGERGLARVLERSATQGIVLRPVLVYGPGVKGNMGILLRLARSPLPLPLNGLMGRRSIVSLVNLGSAIDHALRSPECGPGTYLVADTEALTVAAIVTALREGLGRRPVLLPAPVAVLRLAATMTGRAEVLTRLTGDLVVDTGKLRATGWRPQGSTHLGLVRAIAKDRG